MIGGQGPRSRRSPRRPRLLAVSAVGSYSRVVSQLTGVSAFRSREGDVTRHGHRLAEVSDGEGECTGLHAVPQVRPREPQPPRRQAKCETGRFAGRAVHSLEAEQPCRREADTGDVVAEEDLDDVRSARPPVFVTVTAMTTSPVVVVASTARSLRSHVVYDSPCPKGNSGVAGAST